MQVGLHSLRSISEATVATTYLERTSEHEGKKHRHGPGHPLRLAANAGTAMPQEATYASETTQ